MSKYFLVLLWFGLCINFQTSSGENGISILGLDSSNILHDNNNTTIQYKVKDRDTLNLTCKFRPQWGRFVMRWLVDEFELAKKPAIAGNTTCLHTVIHLNKDRNISIIQCNITEETSKSKKLEVHKTIKLVYESKDEELNGTMETTANATVAVSATNNIQSTENYEDIMYFIVFIFLAVIVMLIVILVIVLVIKHNKKNREKENKILQGSSSERNWELKCSDTYSNPADTLPTVNNTNAVYSSPYKGVVYSIPIPKKSRVVNKIEYENLMVKYKIPHNVTDKTSYENSINYNSTYANLDDKNSNQYSNTLCDRNNGSDMYSYIVVDK